MTKESFIQKLGMELPEKIMQYYDSEPSIFGCEDDEFISDGYIKEISDRYTLLPESLDYVLGYARIIREDEVLAPLARLLKRTLNLKDPYELIAFPAVPDTVPVERIKAIEMTAFLAIYSCAEEVVNYALRMGMPRSVAYDTARVFEGYLTLAKLRLGRDGFPASTYYSWNQRYINHTIFKIGILNFELQHHAADDVYLLTNGTEYKILMNNKEIGDGGCRVGTRGCETALFTATFTETDEYYEGYETDTRAGRVKSTPVRLPKSEWRVELAPGDPIISVHIPRECPLSRENIDNAYSDALRLITDKLGFKPKAIYCCSWLIDPQIEGLVREGSNIVRFQSDYLKYPRIASGRAVFSFLFYMQTEDYTKLPERTSLQRAVKDLYLNGGFIHEVAGLIPIGRYMN